MHLERIRERLVRRDEVGEECFLTSGRGRGCASTGLDGFGVGPLEML